jgi:hypothetical protein
MTLMTELPAMKQVKMPTRRVQFVFFVMGFFFIGCGYGAIVAAFKATEYLDDRRLPWLNSLVGFTGVAVFFFYHGLIILLPQQ